MTDTFEPLSDAVNRVMAKVASRTANVWDGNPISQPGIYDVVPISVYHGANLCVAPSVSSSGLRTIESESPAHYWVKSPYNPNREPEEPSDALDFGKAAHTLFLGESGFREQFAVRPDRWTDWRKAEAQEWRDEMRKIGRTILTPDQVAHIKGMANSLARHPLVVGGILQGDVEQTIAWKDHATGVWLKARPDVLPRDLTIVDLKTCASASRDAVSRSLGDHGYHMQLALVGMGLEAVTGQAPTNDDYVLLFIEKTPPYAARVAPVDAEAIYYGRRQIRRAIDTFARCMEANDWPGFADDLQHIHLPKWLQGRLQFEAENGLLPEEPKIERNAA